MAQENWLVGTIVDEEDELAIESKEERLKGLETQNINIRERLSKIEGQLSAPKQETSRHPLLVVVLSILGTGLAGYWGWLGVQIVNQGKTITNLQTLLSPQIIDNVSQTPENPTSAKQAVRALDASIKSGKKLNIKLVSDAGSKFTEAAATSSDAWNAALAFASYRTSFNVVTRTVPLTPLRDPNLSANFDIVPIEGQPLPHLDLAPGKRTP